MYTKIIEEVEKLAEEDFAKWFKPFLNIDEKSGEILLGVKVPVLRKLAKKYKNINLDLLQQLLKTKIHEIRALALFIMLLKSKTKPETMCSLYLNNLDYINNWDLIDYTAPYIVAPYVTKDTLQELADSEYLWANRIAMVSTIYYIKQSDFALTLNFAKKFMKHPHHLMHKVSGWMLREVGKKDEEVLKQFLEEYASEMPSVMKSYASEKLRGVKTQKF